MEIDGKLRVPLGQLSLKFKLDENFIFHKTSFYRFENSKSNHLTSTRNLLTIAEFRLKISGDWKISFEKIPFCFSSCCNQSEIELEIVKKSIVIILRHFLLRRNFAFSHWPGYLWREAMIKFSASLEREGTGASSKRFCRSFLRRMHLARENFFCQQRLWLLSCLLQLLAAETNKDYRYVQP